MAVVEPVHAARIAFYTALYNDSLRDLGEAQRQRLAQNVSTQTERYQAGQSNRGAVISAQILERELDPRIQEVQRGYQGALLTLATIMGNDPDQSAGAVRPDGELGFAAVDYDLKSETAAALSQRPDLQLARLLVRAAAEDQRIIQAANIIRPSTPRFPAPAFPPPFAPGKQRLSAQLGQYSFLRK